MSKTDLNKVRHPSLIIVSCWQIIVWIFIAAFWILPMVVFLVAIWAHNDKLLLSCGCLICMSASLLVLYLPESYYQPKSFELSGRLYKLLGIRYYKRWMVDGDYMNKLIRQFDADYQVVSRSSSRRFEEKTRSNEREHLILFLVSFPAIIYSILVGWYSYAVFLYLSNVIVNFYPIMLQRYNRSRIYKQLRRNMQL